MEQYANGCIANGFNGVTYSIPLRLRIPSNQGCKAAIYILMCSCSNDLNYKSFLMIPFLIAYSTSPTLVLSPSFSNRLSR